MTNEDNQAYYRRKLFALLHDPQLKSLYKKKGGKGPWEKLKVLNQHKHIKKWWDENGIESDTIGATSDRVSIAKEDKIYCNALQEDGKTSLEIRHPISGQSHRLIFDGLLNENELKSFEEEGLKDILESENPEEVFWWCWRFYPEKVAQAIGNQQSLLLPAETRIPDCPIHSHNSTVSAIAGALFPKIWKSGKSEYPYLLIFTFSPIQEFIKSSRKFLDFWAGSYLLHYLSAHLCWYVAKNYGPDAVITPSLWGQEIIDAFIREDEELGLKEFLPPAKLESLTTAGFPNVITVLVSGEVEAKKLGEKLTQKLNEEWKTIGTKVREAIKKNIMAVVTEKLWNELAPEFGGNSPENPSRREFLGYQQGGQWEWNKLWDAQLEGTWEHYWTAVPLGDPNQDLSINREKENYSNWKTYQNEIAQARTELPTPAEERSFNMINVGTWWGSLQGRLGQLIQAVKNTRNWELPVAPGERSTISGQYSAAHPRHLYNERFREGGGLPAQSMRLFWRVMAEAFPGLFNGSERLNCIELTKRMAWVHGGVAESLGVNVTTATGQPDYEALIRFPNLSSIAAARFAYEHPEKIKEYWEVLNRSIHAELPRYREKFGSLTRRPFQVPNVDQALGDYNGVMFSSKWLADDLGVEESQTLRELVSSAHKEEESQTLRELVSSAHKEIDIKDWSPADWWVIVLGDGDSMGSYVNGSRLKTYEHYLATETCEKLSDRGGDWAELLNTKKRMGPATHVGLNRALLDFSNQLVPYLTEDRFCGRVVYAGGDDVMAVLPLEDTPEYLLSLRAAWSGAEDPKGKFKDEGGYWEPKSALKGLPDRPLFTMGKDATMSLGIIFAHKSVPLPTVLENLWEAEKERAKKLVGVGKATDPGFIPAKDGLCFRVIYSSGNTLEALMKGHLYQDWWEFMQLADSEFSPVLYRLCEELPLRCVVTGDLKLFHKASEAILERREKKLSDDLKNALLDWIDKWEKWAWGAYWKDKLDKQPLGVKPEDLAQLLRFSAFWLDKMGNLTQFDPKPAHEQQEGT
ncbi:type III-B CRISPR-associated protein Cas10/Cmr2 [Anthocerotibacter panamensis]|uniref:type III-B CRISPR-associated protein Cas10/Cmr2 n=1 Tax=Anthocerotibacter panamensis TaxID=2857077 RepID=UPI001C401676|nr:type III-B CRISPR-associated protein Cas10/Cmr2 [Anthocerotibacter panamensis]